MNRRTISLGLSTVCLAALGATGALAQQTTQEEVAELRARVSQLEAANAANSPGLSFGTGNTEVTIYGFVRAEAFYDFDFDQGQSAGFSKIGDPALATGGAFNTSVRTSRLGVRSKTQTDFGDIGTQFEVDLFGGNAGKPELRLRHANITIGDNWLFGQSWSNFMALGHSPTSADFAGPVGTTFARLPQIRYTGHPTEQFQYSLSIEENFVSSSEDPIVTAAAQYSTDTYSIRGAVLAGDTTNFDQSAVTLSGSVKPWTGGYLAMTAVTGEGIASLMNGGADNFIGGVVNDVTGYTVELRQDIGEKWNVGFTYGNEDYDVPTIVGALDYVELESLHVNAFYSPTDNLTLGLEYIRGERKSSTGQTFSADRVGASITLSF
ncbi:MAG: DcaP family trimeric outer membrane transporter [Sulfitobacter sp.]